MDDAYMTSLNARIHAAMQRKQSENEQWRNNFLRSLADLKRMAEDERSKIAVAAPSGLPFHVQDRHHETRRMPMGIKEQICQALESAKNSLCVPTPTYPKLCTAIDTAMAALDCGTTPEPPLDCAVDPTMCVSPATFCNTSVSPAVCTLQPSGGACTINAECQSNYCDLDTLSCM